MHMHRVRPCLSYSNAPFCTIFVSFILSFKCLQRCSRAANQWELLMFLMAHGLSPGGEINMGKRLKPQAFFYNLLPSSCFPFQWPCRASTADSNSKLKPSGLWGTPEFKKQTTTATLTEGQMTVMGRSKQTGDRVRGIHHCLITNLSSMSLQAHFRILTTTVMLVLTLRWACWVTDVRTWTTTNTMKR